MVIRSCGFLGKGFFKITELGSLHENMLMNFAILKMEKGDVHQSQEDLERAFLLMSGEVEFSFSGTVQTAGRGSLFDEQPTLCHLPPAEKVSIKAISEEVELAVASTDNSRSFPSKLYLPEECSSELRGKGTMNEASTRIVRTIFDNSNAPNANLVFGEVISMPGRWSSYPPHYHPQPEIYHYRFDKENGFGVSIDGEEAHIVKAGDTVLLDEGNAHPQVAAPGYALYYLWIIRHLDGERYIAPTFEKEHQWTMDTAAQVWNGKK